MKFTFKNCQLDQNCKKKVNNALEMLNFSINDDLAINMSLELDFG